MHFYYLVRPFSWSNCEPYIANSIKPNNSGTKGERKGDLFINSNQKIFNGERIGRVRGTDLKCSKKSGVYMID